VGSCNYVQSFGAPFQIIWLLAPCVSIWQLAAAHRISRRGFWFGRCPLVVLESLLHLHAFFSRDWKSFCYSIHFGFLKKTMPFFLFCNKIERFFSPCLKLMIWPVVPYVRFFMHKVMCSPSICVVSIYLSVPCINQKLMEILSTSMRLKLMKGLGGSDESNSNTSILGRVLGLHVNQYYVFTFFSQHHALFFTYHWLV
jgi:hypothetical protein